MGDILYVMFIGKVVIRYIFVFYIYKYRLIVWKVFVYIFKYIFIGKNCIFLLFIYYFVIIFDEFNFIDFF